jgi:4-aminobutyrate aminotransferase
MVGPNSQKIIQKTQKYCVKSTFAYPLTVKDAKGCYIEDFDGNKYLDFNSNVSSCNVGYAHPEVMKVLEKYSKIGIHKIAGQDFYSEEQANLAEKLIEITPSNITKAFLINTGTEAVENSMKFAFRKRGPTPGVSCTGAFHGRTLGALTHTFSKPVHKKNYPEIVHERIKFCSKDDDPNMYDINELVERNPNLAYVLVEPVQGEGGYIPASQKFLKHLRQVTKDYGIPLILDEVQSGLGRTGEWWGFQNYGVTPDIIASAKSLQVGATLTSNEYDPDEEGAVSSTWGGGQRIDMAVGLKTIEIIEKENLLGNSKRMGEYLMKRLGELRDNHPEKITEVRGLGLMIGIEFANGDMRNKVELESFKNGLATLGCGFKTIRFAPPLIVTQKEIDKGLEIFEKSVKTIS